MQGRETVFAQFGGRLLGLSSGLGVCGGQSALTCGERQH
jgi:hypothetical protein